VYRFAAGDPISFADPYGLQSDTVTPPPREARPTRAAPTNEGSFNVVEFAVGGINVGRGIAATSVAVDELAVASVGGPFPFVAAVPGTWHLATGVSTCAVGRSNWASPYMTEATPQFGTFQGSFRSLKNSMIQLSPPRSSGVSEYFGGE
jgi:hypothetical protein